MSVINTLSGVEFNLGERPKMVLTRSKHSQKKGRGSSEEGREAIIRSI